MIKILFMDVDGTLTDGKVYIGERGEIMKAFHIKDGYAIRELLPLHRILPVIITGRDSKIVEIRSKELGITEVYQGITDKLALMKTLLAQKGLTFNDAAYMGDDLNDTACMELVKLAGCPADAAEAVKEKAHFISARNGGAGAVREFVEWMTEA